MLALSVNNATGKQASFELMIQLIFESTTLDRFCCEKTNPKNIGYRPLDLDIAYINVVTWFAMCCVIQARIANYKLGRECAFLLIIS